MQETKTDRTKIDKYVQSVKSDVANNGCGEGEYCILTFKTKPNFGVPHFEKHIAFIYKNIDEFAKKGIEDIQKLPSDWGAVSEVWIYD